MKIRMITIALILALAAWLPAIAQQSATPQPAAPHAQAPAAKDAAQSTDKPSCACCAHMKDQKENSASKGTCGEGKDMSCCKKDSNDHQTAMNCCNGTQQCAKNGKGCCGKDAKDCCGKDAMACNSKNGKHCCAEHSCSHGDTQS